MPERFGDLRVVHTRFSRWSKTGVWERVFQHNADDADNEYAMIDSTIVRAHQHSAGAKGGSQSLKRLVAALVGLSTKIHAVVDALGNPVSFHLTPGQACDLEGADQLLPGVVADTILGDKGYDVDVRVIEPLQAQAKNGSNSTQTQPQELT